MIERYSRPGMSAVWSDERRFSLLVKVEAAFLDVIAARKKIPDAEVEALREAASRPLADEVKAREAKTGHEVVAMIGALAARLDGKAPTLARYLHYGLTSSDVLDTAFSLQLREACELLLEGWKKLLPKLARLARKHELTFMAGRTHGVHAEPLTFGVKAAGWHAEGLRNVERLTRARELISRGKLSGAVGMFSQVPPEVEAEVCAKLELEPEPVSTQVVPRDRHADYFHALVLSAAAVERVALEIRHLQKTEALELEEPFTEGQKGSSAMPHKRNPVLCENLCGLARLVRSYEPAVLENCALWHERDISHSSVERVVMPDAHIALDFMLARLGQVIDGLNVYPKRMKANLDGSLGLVFSQTVLLRLIDAGLPRLKAYDYVQRNAMKTWKSRRPFKEVLAADKDVAKLLPGKKLDACFSLASYKSSVKAILKRAGV
jgi:adenylosuccinate lyase